ncbi:HalOD1 output domain-containing protein [Haloarcula marina]|uniref:HalOD1 output domain-containing protein n=1 Tax=Haloarcula marina TaxID=2961574 RepID=UPI0020B7EA2E|nr:HalOD1 output domain-containing protein [Halomicroarcula marina]
MNERDDGVPDRDRHGGVPDHDVPSAWRQTAQRHYDPEEGTEFVTEIVAAIAAAREVGLHEVKSPPLYECIDAPALERTFFESPAHRFQYEDGAVEFRYAEFLVRVQNDGWITVFAAGEDAS